MNLQIVVLIECNLLVSCNLSVERQNDKSIINPERAVIHPLQAECLLFNTYFKHTSRQKSISMVNLLSLIIF